MKEYKKIEQHLASLQLDAKKVDFIEKIDHHVKRLIPRGEADIDHLSERLVVSVSKLRRVMRDDLGLSPARYIMFLRLRYSLKMLDGEPKKSISEIAEQCGFFDHSHFTHTFIHYFGLSPTQYRRQKEKNVEE